MIAIIDYGAGNLRSVSNAVAKLGYKSKVTGNKDDVLKADTVIFPGVGAAADTMESLNKLGMDKVIHQIIKEERPLFAVCIGMQVLFDRTEEGGWNECLGVVPGVVRRLPLGLKVPHMGWNQVKQRMEHPIFGGIPDETNFYFVHSYHCDPEDKSLIAGNSDYGVSICSMLIKGNLIATQFHPERSGEYGLRMYDNFLKMAMEKKES